MSPPSGGPRFTVLTVCTGNIHRSALAWGLLSSWAEWYLPPGLAGQVAIRSAGTGTRRGIPISPRTLVVARALGTDPAAHTSTPLTDDHLEHADLVLTAARSHRDEALARVPGGLRRTFTMREAGRAADAIGPLPAPSSVMELRDRVARLALSRSGGAEEDDDIVDPEGLDESGIDAMVRGEVPALADLAATLFGMSIAERDAYRAAASDAESLRPA